jgi:hypothetical protein
LGIAVCLLVALGIDRTFFARGGNPLIGMIELALGLVLAAILVVIGLRRTKTDVH